MKNFAENLATAIAGARSLSSVFPLLLPAVALTVGRLLSSRGVVLRTLIAMAVAGSVALRWVWAIRFVGHVGYTPTLLVPAIMIGAVAV